METRNLVSGQGSGTGVSLPVRQRAVPTEQQFRVHGGCHRVQ